MIKLTTIVFLLFTTAGYCQRDSLVMHIHTDFRPAIVDLSKDTIQFAPLIANGSKLILNHLEAGEYKIVIHGHPTIPSKTYRVSVKKEQLLKLEFDLQGPCIYNYPKDYIPMCPERHTDNIVPIAYGLIIFTEDSDLDQDDVYLGGCVVSDCDPKFHCKVHKVEF